MGAEVVVYVDPALNIVRWFVSGQDHQSSRDADKSRESVNQMQGNTWRRIADLGPARLHVVLPASMVYHSQVRVPSEDQRVLAQSVPWAVEEELASAVEDNHVAWRQLGDGQAVAVVAKKVMRNLLDILAENQLRPASVTSEMYWLPISGDGQVESSEAANEPVVKAPAVAGDGVVVRRTLWRGGFVPQVAWSRVAQAFAEAIRSVGIRDYMEPDQAINFLQGEFAAGEQEHNRSGQWRWLVLALIVLLISLPMAEAIKLWQLKNQAEQVKNLQLNALREAFVDASPVELADPVNAMRSRIKGLQQLDGQAGGALMRLISGLSSARKKVPAVSIKGLHWRDNTLEVQVVAPSIDSLNAFQQALKQAHVNWQITTGTREALADGFKSILLIRVVP